METSGILNILYIYTQIIGSLIIKFPNILLQFIVQYISQKMHFYLYNLHQPWLNYWYYSTVFSIESSTIGWIFLLFDVIFSIGLLWLSSKNVVPSQLFDFSLFFIFISLLSWEFSSTSNEIHNFLAR